MPMINYQTSLVPDVQDKLVFFPPGPWAGTGLASPPYVTVGDLGFFFRQQSLYEVMYGVQLGATFIVFLMVVFLTRRSQRKTWVFRFNALALFVNVARLISLILPNFTGLADPYSNASNDLQLTIPSVVAILLMELWTCCLLVCFCYASLFLQARSLSNTMWGWKRTCFICMNWFVAIVPPAVRFIVSIPETIDIVRDTHKTPSWLDPFTMGLFAFGTSYHAMLFVVKLGYAIWARRKLGLKQFKPTQIVFIMFCQTMVLPALFAGLEYGLPEGNLYNTLSYTLLSCFLPLTSFWAGVMSQMEREELGLVVPSKSKKPKGPARRKSSNSCNTVWFDNPAMAGAHSEPQTHKTGEPESADTEKQAACRETLGDKLMAGGDTSDVERGLSPERYERNNDTIMASLAAVNRSTTTLHYKSLSPAMSCSWSESSSGLHSGDTTMLRQSLESDGLSTHEATRFRSVLMTPTSPYRVPEVYCDPPTPDHEHAEWEKQPFQRTKLQRISEVPSVVGQGIVTRVSSQRSAHRRPRGDTEGNSRDSQGIRVEHCIELREEHISENSGSSETIVNGKQ
ncbi:serine/threonine-protein kinase bud32 [Ascosphaera pollenicola]|nr:serine/threonine-protein kinase bud32 [Ascosphaera pollenicola]